MNRFLHQSTTGNESLPMFSELLAERRGRVGLTQEELSALSGIRLSALTAMENGELRPGLSELANLSCALRLPRFARHLFYRSAGRQINEKWPSGSQLRLFNKCSHDVLINSQAEAIRLNHKQIGTEHFLVGLLYATESKSASVLRAAGIDRAEVQAVIETANPRQEGPAVEEFDLIPQAKQLIELSVDEACLLNHNFIGSEHLLLAMLRQEETVARDVLREINASPNLIRSLTLDTDNLPVRARLESAMFSPFRRH